ncbi:hypothetical protein LTR70_006038 [Exophiala xenobiotica]|uniref:Uncharacterized protein n=1 Tax=Lithohypha guttulata TaxID=1690604 RepID=A0ABR0KAZ0_9EURO|nr:hypothetical protein LTR24_004770 [Lithohypha guttulata]KAK5317007.1 hypothetical protein LTR70_006038 [Exophiala xenobiotica]
MSNNREAKASGLRLLILAPPSGISQGAEGSSPAEQIPDIDTKTLFSLFLTGLTGSAPSQDLSAFAGYTSHPPLRIQNKYYSANITLWCDELPASATSTQKQGSADLSQWTQQMLSAEAKEAREVIGGIVVILPYVHAAETTHPMQKLEVETLIQYIRAVNELRDLIEDESGRDVATLVAVQDMTPRAAVMRRAEREGASGITAFTETFEETCVSDHGIFGWDIVAWQPETELSPKRHAEAEHTPGAPQHELVDRSRNEYGEQTGMARILEILEQTNWSAPPADAETDEGYGLLSTDDIFESDDEFSAPDLRPRFSLQSRGHRDVVGQQSDDFQREIMGLHFALEEQSQQHTDVPLDRGDSQQVEQLTGLMDRVMATREAAAELSKEDREKFARREVSRIMREMDMGRPV